MTTFDKFNSRNRDHQDGIERHVWGEQTFVKNAGSVIKVRGTGTEDDEAVVINNGVGMHVANNTNTEVFLLSLGSDTNMKHALLSIPRDKQRQWSEGTNGVQCWNDPARALEFNSKRAYIDDSNFATRGGVFEVIDGKVYIRADVLISGSIGVAGTITSPNVPATPLPGGGGTVTVPGFEE